MYDTSGSHSVCYAAPADENLAGRLSWLGAEIARAEDRGRLALALEEERALSLLDPMTTAEAYAWFGTFLGLFPPFAIFGRILGAALSEGTPRSLPTADGLLFWCLLFLVMSAACCLVGRKFGGFLGRNLGDPRARTWPAFVFLATLLGIPWGIVTGGAGGALGFGIGAIFGIACAVPVALAAFPVFAILHRLLSHGGMIEERRLWPLAFGVPAAVAALIMSPWIMK